MVSVWGCSCAPQLRQAANPKATQLLIAVLQAGEGCIIALYHSLIPAKQEACMSSNKQSQSPKPLAQSNRARCLRLADFDLRFNPAHIVEDSFSSLL